MGDIQPFLQNYRKANKQLEEFAANREASPGSTVKQLWRGSVKCGDLALIALACRPCMLALAAGGGVTVWGPFTFSWSGGTYNRLLAGEDEPWLLRCLLLWMISTHEPHVFSFRQRQFFFTRNEMAPIIRVDVSLVHGVWSHPWHAQPFLILCTRHGVWLAGTPTCYKEQSGTAKVRQVSLHLSPTFAVVPGMGYPALINRFSCLFPAYNNALHMHGKTPSVDQTIHLLMIDYCYLLW